MIIIGEKINASRKAVKAALEARDDKRIVRIAQRQVKAGAHYLDVNGGDPHPGREAENMQWLMGLVTKHTDVPAAIDSADADAVRVGLSMAHAAGKKPILNSVSLETSRLEALLPVLSEHECMVVGLLMADDGTPTGVDDRLERREAIIAKLTAAGKAIDEIIIDPAFLPIATDPANGPGAINAIAAIRLRWPGVHIGGGVSNISFGLPKRRYVNVAALTQAVAAGMDVAITDPCTPGIMAAIYAAEAVAGKDDFCMNYVTAERQGKLP